MDGIFFQEQEAWETEHSWLQAFAMFLSHRNFIMMTLSVTISPEVSKMHYQIKCVWHPICFWNFLWMGIVHHAKTGHSMVISYLWYGGSFDKTQKKSQCLSSYAVSTFTETMHNFKNPIFKAVFFAIYCHMLLIFPWIKICW